MGLVLSDQIREDVEEVGGSLVIRVVVGGGGEDTVPHVEGRQSGIGHGVPSSEQVEVDAVGLEGFVLC